jgi:hypothetical protein
MHYLAGILDYEIHYFGYPTVLDGYIDANWISNVVELYAISGYVFTLCDAAISWRSCKQTILMRSTMNVELTTLDIVIDEVDWLHELLMNLLIVEKHLLIILMNHDNETMIIKVDSSKDNMKSSRHIKRWLKSIRKMRNSRVITLDYIQTEKNLADLLTTGLPRNVMDVASKEMGLRAI